MTIKLNFDHSHYVKLIQMLDWLKGMGVVTSYEVENKEQTPAENPLSKKESELQEDRMIELGLKQIENGQVMSHEEAMGKIRDSAGALTGPE